MFHQFFATRPKISITTPDGERIFFSGGTFVTDKKHLIEFLQAEVDKGHPMIYIKAGEETLTAEQLDPMLAIKERIIAEYEAQKQIQQDPQRSMGVAAKADVLAGATNSKTIGNITVGAVKK